MALPVAAACHPFAGVDEPTLAPRLRERLGSGLAAVRALPPAGALALPESGGVIVAGDGGTLPRRELSPEQRQELRSFVARGGRLLLLGPAARFAKDLDLTPVRPGIETFRWGFDPAAVTGHARLGGAATGPAGASLFAGLEAGPGGVVFWAGGAPCDVPCGRFASDPGGDVLARLVTQRDGSLSVENEPVVVQWACGRGAVLAVGVPLDAADDGGALAANCRQFAANLLRWLAARPLVLVEEQPGAPPPRPVPAELPHAAELAHWGWQLPLPTGPTAGQLLVDELVPRVSRAGADLLAIEVSDATGLGLVWRPEDPLRPPATLRSGAATVPAAVLLAGAAEARARGILPSLALPHWPLGPRPSERFGLLRWLSRELLAPVGASQRGFAGVQLDSWPRDPSGVAAAMLEDLEPAAFLVRAGETGPSASAGVRALHGADGAMPGLDLRGVSGAFRNGFPATAFPAGVLPIAAGDGADWVVQQGLDFVRERRGGGGALWWRVGAVQELGGQLAAYARGVAQEGVRAAVAMPCEATGEGGTRAAAATLVGLPPAALGATAAFPARTCVLQNNWLRLAGSGGALEYDPRGLGRFDRPGPLRVSDALLVTRLFGSRPDGEALASWHLDLLAPGLRPAGEYGAQVVLATGALVDRRLPQRLAAGLTPDWPAAAQLELDLRAGCYALELTVRAIGAGAALAVRWDGALLAAVPCPVPGAAVTTTLPVHVVRGGVCRLEFAHLHGGSVAFERGTLERVGDLAVDATVELPAGAMAQLVERSASSYHQERLVLRTLADLPGFVLRWQCERAARNLQVERTLRLPGYAAVGARGVLPPIAADGSRAGFVMRAADAAQPDLVVVVLQAQRHDRVVVADEQVQWSTAPEAGAASALGVLLLPRAISARWLPHAATVLGALDRPIAADLGPGGEFTLVGELPFAWPRPVQLRQRAGTPYAIEADGVVCWRGAQPGVDGCELLAVWTTPGAVTRIRTGPALRGATRPGPGSAGVVALRDLGPREVEVRVLQPSRLGPPAVMLAEEPGQVWLDGQPWAFRDGATVFLPDRPGSYRLTTAPRTSAAAPTVAACSARLRSCAFDAARGELVLVADSEATRPAELPYTARLTGPRPQRVEGGEVIAPQELRWPDAETADRAGSAGTTIRFRAGVTRIFYDHRP